MEGFDIGIIGCGISGTFAALRIAEKFKETKTIGFDIGRPPAKRRRPLEGFLGCFPTGNGRLYPNNINQLQSFIDGRKINHANQWVMDYFKKVNAMKLITDHYPHKNMHKQILDAGFDITLNDYYQWKPESVHKLSHIVSTELENSKNIFFSFDNEVFSIKKEDNTFIVYSSEGNFECKKIILCVGRSGWRWSSNLYKEFGLTFVDDYAKYGIRVELASHHLDKMHKSHCSLVRKDISIGPFCWNGSVIPEDHADVVISAFRSNEDRWKSEKVSFALLKTIECKGQGVYQTDRMGKLTFLLYNDRVNKEKIKSFIKHNSIISVLPDYNWLNDTLTELSDVFPQVCDYGYMYLPCIEPLAAKVKIDDKMQTEIDGLYVTGESAGIKGIMGAAISGCLVANEICKDEFEQLQTIKKITPEIAKIQSLDMKILDKVRAILIGKVKQSTGISMDKLIKILKIQNNKLAIKNMISKAINGGFIFGYVIKRGRNGGIYRQVP